MESKEKYYSSLIAQKKITQHLLTSLDMAFDLALTQEAQEFRTFLIKRLNKINKAIEAHKEDKT